MNLGNSKTKLEMFKKLRILTVVFTAQIEPYELPAFRGAIIDKVGEENILFHNHLEKGFLYKYPTIQYKIINKQAALVCVDDGVDEIHKYFKHSDWSLWIGDKKIDIKVAKLFLNKFNLQVWNTKFYYSIRRWIALSQENYEKYKTIEAETERIEMLERILKGNILAFAKGVKWTVDKPIELKIINTPQTHLVKIKGTKLMSFDLQFTTNVFLPNYIGLGKHVSIGFGMVRQIKNNLKK